MNRTRTSSVLAATILLFTTYPLPAPIFEPSSPTPAPQQPAKPKIKHSKPKTDNEGDSTKTVSFAGTWTGTATGRIQQAIFGPKGFSSSYKLQISPDERTVNWTSSAWIFAKFQAPVQKKGRVLTWTCDRHDIVGRTAIFCRLEMDANGTGRTPKAAVWLTACSKAPGKNSAEHSLGNEVCWSEPSAITDPSFRCRDRVADYCASIACSDFGGSGDTATPQSKAKGTERVEMKSKYPDKIAVGGAWPGFDDSKASWSLNRHMSQRCGQTLNDTMNISRQYYTDEAASSLSPDRHLE